MKKFIVLLTGCCVLMGGMVGCVREEKAQTTASSASKSKTQQYKDGTYEVKTKVDNEGYFTEASVKIQDDKIVSAEWEIKDANRGNRVFDETYEEVFEGNDAYKKQCRQDLEGAKTYSAKLIEEQEVEKVDAVSGATWTNAKFKEVVAIALEQAKK